MRKFSSIATIAIIALSSGAAFAGDDSKQEVRIQGRQVVWQEKSDQKPMALTGNVSDESSQERKAAPQWGANQGRRGYAH